MTYTHKTRVWLPDTDAAGILFFGNYFRLAHDAYEAFMESLGFDFGRIIRETDFRPLIAHAEASYKKPLSPGERVTIELTVVKLGETSFHLSYSLKNAAAEVAATVKTVHVATSKKDGRKVDLPDDLRRKLTDFM